MIFYYEKPNCLFGRVVKGIQLTPKREGQDRTNYPKNKKKKKTQQKRGIKLFKTQWVKQIRKGKLEDKNVGNP